MIMARAINFLAIQTDLVFQNAKYLKLIAVGGYRFTVMTVTRSKRVGKSH